MENTNLYSFPAVGSLKEKRLARFEPEHNAAKAAVEALEKKVDEHADPTKEKEVRDEFVAVNEKLRKAKDKVVDASDVAGAANKVKDLQSKIEAARAKFDQKVIAVETKRGADWKTAIDAENGVIRAPAPDPTTAKERKVRDLLKDSKVLDLIKKDVTQSSVRIDVVKARVNNVKDAIGHAGGTVALTLPGDIDAAYKDIKAIEDRKGSAEELKLAHQNLKNAALANFNSAAFTDDYAATIPALASKLFAATNALEKAEAHLNKGTTTPPTTPTPAPEVPADIKSKYDAVVVAAEGGKDVKGALDKLNDGIKSDQVGPTVAKLNEKMKDLKLKYEFVVEVDATGKPKSIKLSNAISYSPEDKEKKLFDELVQLVKDLLKNLGLLKGLGTLEVDNINKRIKTLEEQRDALKGDPTKAAEVKKLEARIEALKVAKQVAEKAAEFDPKIIVKIDDNGVLSFEGGKAVHINALKLIAKKVGEVKEGVGGFELGNIDAKALAYLLKEMSKMVPYISQQYGYGRMPWNAAGRGAMADFDPRTGFPRAQAYDNVQFDNSKPGPMWGASNKKTRS